MMSTNYNHILNENLDMLPGYDFPSDMIELDDGSVLTIEEIYDERYDDDYSNGPGWYYDDDGFHYEE